jgi:hypothetical protein
MPCPGRSNIPAEGSVAVLFAVVSRVTSFWMGWPVFVSSIIAIALLVFAARLAPREDHPRQKRRA